MELFTEKKKRDTSGCSLLHNVEYKRLNFGKVAESAWTMIQDTQWDLASTASRTFGKLTEVTYDVVYKCLDFGKVHCSKKCLEDVNMSASPPIDMCNIGTLH